MSTQPITHIAITDDHPMILEGFSNMFKDFPHYVVHLFSEKSETLAFLQTNLVDVMMLDINLKDSNGVELCHEIKQLQPKAKVIGFSNQTEQSLIQQFIQNGGNGYILKNASKSEITKLIDQVIQGEMAFCNESLKIISKVTEKPEIPRLTKREKQILTALANAQTSAEIANELYISLGTVESHRRNLMQKFKAKNIVELIRKAFELKMI